MQNRDNSMSETCISESRYCIHSGAVLTTKMYFPIFDLGFFGFVVIISCKFSFTENQINHIVY